MVPDVELLEPLPQRREHLGVAVPQVVGATVQVQIEELVAVDVPDAVALAPSDHEGDVRSQPGLDAVGHQVLVTEPQDPAFALGHSLEACFELHDVSWWIQLSIVSLPRG